ncbi:NIL domain-containing protein [Chloroflexota bacterium]
MAVAKRIVLRFPKRLVDRPIIFRLVKDYDLEFNILKASVTQEDEGIMVLELKGEQAEYDRSIRFLLKTGVHIQSLSQDVTRNDERCTHCGACITICPAEALEVEPLTRRVLFHNDRCIACGLCIKGCPARAMEEHF